VLNRKKLLITSAVLITCACLLVAAVTTRALNASMGRLAESEQVALASDRYAANAIDKVFARWENLAILLARQAQPRPEWSIVIEELETSLVQFTGESRLRATLPQQSARANLYLGRLYLLHGNLSGAADRIQQAIQLAVSVGDPGLAGEARNTLACMQTILGDREKALAALTEACRDLDSLPGQEHALAIAYCNHGLVLRSLGRDGAPSIQQAILTLQQCSESRQYGLTSELLIDMRMAQSEMLWSQGRLREAAQLTREAYEQLRTQFLTDEIPNLDKMVVARNRYVSAARYAERNYRELQQLVADNPDAEQKREQLAATVAKWQWHRLVDLVTDRVSSHLEMRGTMTAEFDPQAGLVVAWGMFDWTHEIVVEIARHTYDRTQLVIVADNEDSLEEAQAALDSAGIPLDRIRFSICDMEAPWFRDQGPLVSRDPSGETIWLDFHLTRQNLKGRTVLDALPQVLRRNWRTRVVDLPIHVEGGMILANGRGLTVGSSAILERNRAYGFTDEVIYRELKRGTGATELSLIDTLVGELTEHVDLFVTFTGPTTVVVGEVANQQDPNAAMLDRVATTLGQVTTSGQRLTVERIPMPESNGQWFPSYTNVVYANGVLLVPSYEGDANREREAIVRQTYERLLPGWEVVFVDCTRLRQRGGALHCLVANLGPTQFDPVFRKPPIALADGS
jgi:agmatine/peptidylarginine deiminase